MHYFISILILVTICNLTNQIDANINITDIEIEEHTDYLLEKFDGNFSYFRKRLGFKNILQTKILNNNKTIECLSATEMLQLAGNNSDNTTISKEGLIKICPFLLASIDSRVCRFPKKDPNSVVKTKNNLLIWVFSITAVIICSLVGLLVVWLIPIIPKSYYHCISQLLIALAVGSLTGDALLHLIPHALLDNGKGGHSHGDESEHSMMVWKALVALVGIHVFFLTERITILCQNVHSKRKSRLKQLSHEFSENPNTNHHHNDNTSSLSRPNHSHHKSPNNKMQWASKSRKYSGIDDDVDNCGETIGVQLCNKPQTKPHDNSDCPDSMNLVLCQKSTNNMHVDSEAFNASPMIIDMSNLTTAEPLISSDTNNHFSNINEETSILNYSNKKTGPTTDIVPLKQTNANWSNNEADKLINKTSADCKIELNSSPTKPTPDNNMHSPQKPHQVHIAAPANHQHLNNHSHHIGAGGATVQESLAHPFKNKPHGHHHGHSHDLSSVKSIAYTVIAGDGLHNFCDGIAIGAAFANDLRGGMSTAIAVLCHELPHELGDFVVLLHAGMSIRTAIFYNLLSSIFCAAGMVIGVLLGKLPNVSSWVFMLTAGMFLYIALVDMIPELSTRRLQGKKWVHRPSILFLFQNIGLITGICIMLVIALFEDKMF